MKKRSKKIFTIAAILLVLCSGVGGTAAYLTGMFGLTNTFTQGSVVPSVEETFDGTVKKNVFVQNKGNVPIYVRCRIFLYRELGDQSVDMEGLKEGTDYTMQYPKTLNESWLSIGDIYYYKKPLKPGEKTENLIDQCELKREGLVVDISAQAIQAEPKKAVQEAWKEVRVGNDRSP